MTPTKKRKRWPIIVLILCIIGFAGNILQEEEQGSTSSYSYPYSAVSSRDTFSRISHPDYSFGGTQSTYSEAESEEYSFAFSMPESASSEEASSAVTSVSSDPRDEIPTEWRSHLYLESKNSGHCEELVGNVLVTFVFTDDAESSWTAAAKADAQDFLLTEMRELSAHAKNYGVELSLSYWYTEASIDIAAEPGTSDWKGDAIRDIGYDSVIDAHKSLEASENVSSAPIVFVFNKDGRAYANFAIGKSAVSAETAVLFVGDLGAFRHELFHLYGAKDLYCPDVVADIASTYLAESIMNDGDVTDDYTAYVIGWTETLSASAEAFLEETKGFTQEFLDEEQKKNQFTGYLEIEYSYGRYEGELVFGVLHGQGTLYYHNGDIYTGGFENGLFSGYGEYTWAGGVTYKGYYVKGSAEGHGRMTWTDGSYYDGEYRNGQRHGTGTYVWADGSYYVGDWENGERNGYGVLTHTDGSIQEGLWENSEFKG